MDQLNRVELRGVVGSVRISEVGDTRILRMTVATNRAYRAKDLSAVIETTFHNISAFPGEGVCDIDSISRGDKVEITGRIANQRVVGEDGTERTVSEIRAYRVQRLDADGCLQYEM